MPRRASRKIEKKKPATHRPIWAGTVSFGLVNVPVKLFSAVSQKEVHFHQLHDKDGARIKQERVCTADGEAVSYQHIVKGYEISPGHYVKVTQKELEAFDPPSRRTIEIDDFVDLHEIDPIYYEHTYYLAPGRDAERPYFLLHAALARRQKAGIAQVVLWNKQHLCVLRPLGPVLSLSTLQYADEILPAADVTGVSEEAAKPRERELSMAEQIIESLSARFRPEKYRDEHRDKVLTFLRRKAEGGKVIEEPEPREEVPVRDLMQALKASLAAVQARKQSAVRAAPAARAKRRAPRRTAGTRHTRTHTKAA